MISWTPVASASRLAEVLRWQWKLFAFLRDDRHELFDDPFQAELESMYRDSGADKDPTSPALLAMASRRAASEGIRNRLEGLTAHLIALA